MENRVSESTLDLKARASRETSRPFRDGHHIGRGQSLAYRSHQLEPPHVAADWVGELMRKTSLFSVASLIVDGVGVWAASNAKEMPAVEFVDYTFVFR